MLGEIVVSGGYDALLRYPLHAPSFVIDLGANTGLFTRWLLAMHPTARVVAVEPEPSNLTCLDKNVAGLPVKVVPAAIGAWSREVELHTSSGEHGFTIVGEPAPGAGSTRVPVVTMATVADGAEPIDLLKVDIEGAEAELFADCAGWIGRVKTLLVECHGDYKIANLLSDLHKGGAAFRLVEADYKPEWGFEVGLFHREGDEGLATA